MSKYTISLPNANYFQASQCSAYLRNGKGTYKEIVYKKVRDNKGNARWEEQK